MQPDVAVFGEKDFQQLMLIKQNGARFGYGYSNCGLANRARSRRLAMSSRNGYLTAEERQRAPAFNQIYVN